MRDIRDRLKEIAQSQSGQCHYFGLTDVDVIFLLGYYLNEIDLEQIRPYLEVSKNDRLIGNEGRFQGIPVFNISSQQAVQEPPMASYEGVGFRYVEMDHGESLD